MYNHEPSDYQCPFCRIVRASSIAHSTDIVYSSEMVTAFLALGRWPNNPIDVLVVPNEHFENLYDLPASYVQPLHWLTRAIALALKGVYQCDGISTRQHNEDAGDQDVWHYHVHVTPRFGQDGFYQAKKVNFPEAERLQEAQLLRNYVFEHQIELFER